MMQEAMINGRLACETKQLLRVTAQPSSVGLEAYILEKHLDSSRYVFPLEPINRRIALTKGNIAKRNSQLLAILCN